MIAYGYLRVSGKGQVDGDGPDRQKAAILNFCKIFGLGDPLFFYEAAVSGTVEAMDRPKFVELIEAIERLRKVTPEAEVCIVVECLDRLARRVIVGELLLAECARRDIRVYAADHMSREDLAAVEDDPTRKALRQMMEVMAEWEKSVTVRKLRAARMRARMKTGRCEGVRPYGFCNQAEGRRMQRMIQLREDGWSYAEIARKMNEAGSQSRDGGAWTRAKVYQMVNRRGVKRLPSISKPIEPEEVST